MEIVSEVELNKDYITAKYIGSGTTSKCYLLANGNVLKVYKNSYNAVTLFNRFPDMVEHLKYLNEVSNGTFVGPTKVYVDSSTGKVLGYMMPYIKGRTLYNIKLGTKLDLYKDYLKGVRDDTYLLSSNGYRLKDMHDRNVMIADNKIYIIDLDNGDLVKYFTEDMIFERNMRDIADTLVKSIFKVPQYKDLFFNNFKLDELYSIVACKDYREFDEFIDCLADCLNKNNPNIFDARVKSKKLIYTKNHPVNYIL